MRLRRFASWLQGPASQYGRQSQQAPRIRLAPGVGLGLHRRGQLPHAAWARPGLHAGLRHLRARLQSCRGASGHRPRLGLFRPSGKPRGSAGVPEPVPRSRRWCFAGDGTRSGAAYPTDAQSPGAMLRGLLPLLPRRPPVRLAEGPDAAADERRQDAAGRRGGGYAVHRFLVHRRWPRPRYVPGRGHPPVLLAQHAQGRLPHPGTATSNYRTGRQLPTGTRTRTAC